MSQKNDVLEFCLTLIGTKEQIKACLMKAENELEKFDKTENDGWIETETFANSLPLEKQCNVNHLMIEVN